MKAKLSLLEQAKQTAKELHDLIDQIEYRESEMTPDSTARLENIREAKQAVEDCFEAIRML